MNDSILTLIPPEELKKIKEGIKLTIELEQKIIAASKTARENEWFGNFKNSITTATQAIEKLDSINAKMHKDAVTYSEKLRTAIDKEAKARYYNAAAKKVNVETDIMLRKEQEKEAKAAKEVTDAYKKLSIEHKKALGEAKQLGAIYGHTSKEFLTAAKNANVFGDKLKAIDAALGQHGRNVGNYASHWNGLRNSINQIGRELPNFAANMQTGFLAISNNLPMLADEIGRLRAENKELIAQGKPTVSVFRQIASAVFSWQTAMVIAITLLVKYGEEIVNAIVGTDTLAERVQAASNKIAASYSKEATELAALKARFEDVRSTMEDKKEVVNELNKKYEDQIGHMNGIADAERFFVEKTPDMLKALELRAKAEGALSVIREEEEKQLKFLADPQSALSGMNKLRAGVKATGQALADWNIQNVADYYDWNKVILGSEAANREMKNSRATQSLALKEYITLQNEANALDVKGGFETGGRSKADTGRGPKDAANQLIAAYRELNKAKLMLNNQQIEQDNITQQAILDNEKTTLAAKLEALERFENNKKVLLFNSAASEIDTEERKIQELQEKLGKAGKLKLTQDQQAAIETQIEASNTRILALQEKLNTDINLVTANGVRQRFNILREGSEKIFGVIQKDINNISLSYQQAKEAEITAQNQSLSRREISAKQHSENIREIDARYELQALEATKSFLIKKLDSLELEPEERKRLQELITKIEKDESEKRAGITIDEVKRKEDAYLAVQGKIMDAASAWQDTFHSIYQAQLSKEIAALERQGGIIDQTFDRRVRAIQLSGKTEAEQQDMIRKEEARTEGQRKELAEKRRIAKRKEARADKAAQVSNVIGQTAIAIMSAFQTYKSTPLAYVMAAVNGAIGAANIIRIASQPIPEYKYGTGDHKGGLAVVGDGHKTEYAVTPEGRIFATPKVPTIVDLPKHSKVYPNISEFMNSPHYSQHLNIEQRGQNNKELVTVLKEVKQAIITKPSGKTAIYLDGQSTEYRRLFLNR